MSSTVQFLPSCSSLLLTHHSRSSILHKSRARAAAVRCNSGPILSETHERKEAEETLVGRRHAMASAAAACGVSVFGFAGDGLAVKQGLLAGRIPGLSEPDEKGWRTYRRPDDKSGGHGVGWSPITPYTFKVPYGWEEVPVSIADLGGTEIDLRFGSAKEGRLFVIVAPVRRFADLDDATIQKIGPPEKVIDAFGPEVIGESVEGKVLATGTAEHSGRTYYQFELEPPHVLITATAAGNRLYLFNVTASGLQWKRVNGGCYNVEERNNQHISSDDAIQTANLKQLDIIRKLLFQQPNSSYKIFSNIALERHDFRGTYHIV